MSIEVNNESGVQVDEAELVALAKKQPGKISMGSAGIGTGQDISARQFSAQAGVEMLNVQYKGGAPALNDLLGGQILSMFETSPTALPYARDGKQLRALLTDVIDLAEPRAAELERRNRACVVQACDRGRRGHFTRGGRERQRPLRVRDAR